MFAILLFNSWIVNMINKDRYRQQASSLLSKMHRARSLFAKHKPSIGYVGEQALRLAIKRILPKGFDVCQGFVINNNTIKDDNISNQCDIIIHRKEKRAIAYSIGDLKIINISSVIAVIEVKSSIRYKSFSTTLKAFEKLNELGVNCFYIFIFSSISKKSLQRWFFQYKFPKFKNKDYLFFQKELFDWPDKEWLPNAILSLNSGNYYKLDHLQDDENDYIGYASYLIKDKKNKDICCLQELFSSIMYYILNDPLINDISNYSIKDGFRLYRI